MNLIFWGKDLKCFLFQINRQNSIIKSSVQKLKMSTSTTIKPSATANNNDNNEKPPSTPEQKKKPAATTKTEFVKSEVLDRLTGKKKSSSNAAGDESPKPNQQQVEQSSPLSPSSPSTSARKRSISPLQGPVLAQREYISELRVRQASQLTSIASYLETHVREPIGGGLCGKNLGGWTYGPSYSRTVESLEPEAESYPPTKSARRTVMLSSARSLPYSLQQEVRQRELHTHIIVGGTQQQHQHHHSTGRTSTSYSPPASPVSTSRSTVTASNSRPGTASTKSTSSRTLNRFLLAPTSLYNVVLEAPFNVRPASAAFATSTTSAGMINVTSSARNGSSIQQQQNQQRNTSGSIGNVSARPLSSEFYYPSRKKALRNDQLMSKSDLAVEKHREKQRKLEMQKEKLKNAAPMEFRWQMPNEK